MHRRPADCLESCLGVIMNKMLVPPFTVLP
jgi:hypothetical protein